MTCEEGENDEKSGKAGGANKGEGDKVEEVEQTECVKDGGGSWVTATRSVLYQQKQHRKKQRMGRVGSERHAPGDPVCGPKRDGKETASL